MHCPSPSPSEVCGIQCANTSFTWDIVVCVCKVIAGHSRDKPARLCALAGHALAEEQQCSLEHHANHCYDCSALSHVLGQSGLRQRERYLQPYLFLANESLVLCMRENTIPKASPAKMGSSFISQCCLLTLHSIHGAFLLLPCPPANLQWMCPIFVERNLKFQVNHVQGG